MAAAMRWMRNSISLPNLADSTYTISIKRSASVKRLRQGGNLGRSPYTVDCGQPSWPGQSSLTVLAIEVIEG